jgi:hypothetical protein
MRRHVFLGISLAIIFPLAATARAESDPIGKPAPNFSFQTSKGKKDLRAYRGKWLLLQFGGSWCEPSELSSTVFSDIRRKLDNKPFEFVEIGDDPTVADFELYSDVNFSGVRGVEDGDVPELLSGDTIPRWYLIDPEGIIREKGELAVGAELRATIAKALPASFLPKGDSLDPSPDQQAREQARIDKLQGKYADAEKGFLGIFQRNPTDFLALMQAGYAHAFLSSVEGARNFVQSKLPKGAVLPDREQVLFLRLPKPRPFKFERAQTLVPLLQRHPDSVYLKGDLISNTTLPDEIDTASLRTVYRFNRAHSSMNSVFFTALALESLGKPDAALGLLDLHPSGVPLPQTIGVLARNHKEALARDLIKPWAPELASTADAEKSWAGCNFYVALCDWPSAAIYGARYAAVRTDRPFGLEIQWLAAIRSKDFAKADALQAEVEQFVKDKPAYAVAQGAFKGNPPPEAKSMISGFDALRRIDNFLPYALLAERHGQMEQARTLWRELRTLTDCNDPENANATSLALSLGH